MQLLMVLNGIFTLLIINALPIIYLVLMIQFLNSNNPKLKITGKIMLGLIILPVIIFIILFLTCLAQF